MIHIDSLNCAGFQDHRQTANSLIRRFDGSLLAEWDEESIERSLQIVRKIRQTGKYVFVCASGGSKAPLEILRDMFPANFRESPFPFLLDSVTEAHLDFLRSLREDVWNNSHWLFISRSGRTAESLFYAEKIRELGRKNKIPLKNKITCLTGDESSPLVKRLCLGDGDVFPLNGLLPGRFSFFTLGGLVQSGLSGISPLELREGFRFAEDSLSTDILAHILLQSQRGGKCFFSYSHPRFRSLSLWWEKSWSESLFKESAVRSVPLLRAHSLSEICHAYLEELFGNGGWIWDLSLRSRQGEAEEWGRRQSGAFKNMAVREKRPLLSLFLEDLTVRSAGALIAVLLKTLHGVGLWLDTALYNQPFVDQYKREFSLSGDGA